METIEELECEVYKYTSIVSLRIRHLDVIIGHKNFLLFLLLKQEVGGSCCNWLKHNFLLILITFDNN